MKVQVTIQPKMPNVAPEIVICQVQSIPRILDDHPNSLLIVQSIKFYEDETPDQNTSDKDN